MTAPSQVTTVSSKIRLPDLGSPEGLPAYRPQAVPTSPYLGVLTPLLFAASVSVMSVAVPDPIAEAKFSGASTVLKASPAAAKKVSFAQARRLALETLERAETALQVERQQEALLFANFDEEDA